MKKQAIELKDEYGRIYWVIDESGTEVAVHNKGHWDGREIIGFGGMAWMVLAKSDDDKAALIISLYVLEERPYQSESREGRERFGEYYDDLTWEQSEIREYLNGAFIEKNFCPAEALQIIPARLRNDDNEATGARGGNDTLDKVFLLSISEADEYLWSCLMGLEKTRGRYHWWLRSPAECAAWPAFVMDWSDEPDGEAFPLLCDGDEEHGDGCSFDYGVRPAMWIELERDCSFDGKTELVNVSCFDQNRGENEVEAKKERLDDGKAIIADIDDVANAGTGTTTDETTAGEMKDVSEGGARRIEAYYHIDVKLRYKGPFKRTFSGYGFLHDRSRIFDIDQDGPSHQFIEALLSAESGEDINAILVSFFAGRPLSDSDMTFDIERYTEMLQRFAYRLKAIPSVEILEKLTIDLLELDEDIDVPFVEINVGSYDDIDFARDVFGEKALVRKSLEYDFPQSVVSISSFDYRAGKTKEQQYYFGHNGKACALYDPGTNAFPIEQENQPPDSFALYLKQMQNRDLSQMWFYPSGDAMAVEKADFAYPEIIEFGGRKWLVLARTQNGNAAFVVSMDIAERRSYESGTEAFHKKFGDDWDSLTWEDSEIREYLNSEYIAANFSDVERERILSVQIPNDGNKLTHVTGGNGTLDRIFLLSLDEVYEFYPFLEKLRADDLDSGSPVWVLRSPAESREYPAFVDDYPEDPDEECPLVGNGFGVGGDCAAAEWGIRPAMWIELDEDGQG